jgi:hypothetical protein
MFKKRKLSDTNKRLIKEARIKRKQAHGAKNRLTKEASIKIQNPSKNTIRRNQKPVDKNMKNQANKSIGKK